MTDAIVVTTTVASMDTAADLAERLVDARLAACVQIVPGVRSVYRWQGAVHHDDEVLLTVKARADDFDAIAGLLNAHHPYELPEVVAVPIERASDAYLDWIHRMTESKDLQ